MIDQINNLIFNWIHQSTHFFSSPAIYNYCLWRSDLDETKKILHITDYVEMSDHLNKCFNNNEYPREEFDCFLGIGKYDTPLQENYKEIKALYRTGDLLTKDSVDLDVFDHPIVQGAKYKGLLISPRLNYVLKVQVECSYLKDMEKIERYDNNIEKYWEMIN